MKMQVADRLSGVGEYYFSKKLREIDQMRAAGKDIIILWVWVAPINLPIRR